MNRDFVEAPTLTGFRISSWSRRMKRSEQAGEQIVGQTASEIARSVADGALSAVEVLEAHLQRIEAVNPTLNAIVVPLFDQARQAAEEADLARKRGEKLGPLHGVPVTIKECLDVAGTSSTLGVSHLAGRVATDDGPLVARLRRAGALLIGKTNIPQLAMYMETDGPLFGRCNNPWNLQRSPGGSSGGEAAMLAAGGSALGLGTDAGGSIRHPAHCCGIFGLKPTSGRLTQTDLPVTTVAAGAFMMPSNLAGLQAILQPGPMARCVDDLNLAMQVLAAPGLEQIDPTVPPMSWPDMNRVEVQRLRVGYYTDDGTLSVAPAVRRAVREAVEALQSAGIEVEPFDPPDVHDAMQLFRSLIFPDGGAAFRRMLGAEKLDPRLKQSITAASMPEMLRPLVAWALERGGQHRLADSLRSLRRLSADGFRQRVAQRAAYCTKFLDVMNRQCLDVIVCPAFPVPAPPHGAGTELGMMTSYTAVYNLLGFPAGVVPFTRVSQDETSERAATRCRVERAAKRIETDSQGLPIGIQIVARPWREDIVLAVMKRLEAIARARDDFPESPPTAFPSTVSNHVK